MKEKNKEKINQVSDPYVKASLSRKEVAIDFLKGHLPKKLVDMLDLESLELIKESFIDGFFQYHDDVTYKAKINGQEGLIYFLIELSLPPNNLMAFMRWCHLISLLESYLQQNKEVKKLPFVLPICLRNGQVENSFSPSVYDCFEEPAIAREFKLLERPLLVKVDSWIWPFRKISWKSW